MDQNEQMDIYRTFYSNKNEHTFFSAPHKIFSKIDHILDLDVSLNRLKKTEIRSCIQSDHHD